MFGKYNNEKNLILAPHSSLVNMKQKLITRAKKSKSLEHKKGYICHSKQLSTDNLMMSSQLFFETVF